MMSSLSLYVYLSKDQDIPIFWCIVRNDSKLSIVQASHTFRKKQISPNNDMTYQGEFVGYSSLKEFEESKQNETPVMKTETKLINDLKAIDGAVSVIEDSFIKMGKPITITEESMIKNELKSLNNALLMIEESLKEAKMKNKVKKELSANDAYKILSQINEEEYQLLGCSGLKKSKPYKPLHSMYPMF